MPKVSPPPAAPAPHLPKSTTNTCPGAPCAPAVAQHCPQQEDVPAVVTPSGNRAPGGIFASMGVAGEFRELRLHQGSASTPALPSPRNTSAKHLAHSLVTFSGSQISRGQSLRFVVAWPMPRSPVRLFQRVCFGVSHRLRVGQEQQVLLYQVLLKAQVSRNLFTAWTAFSLP